LCYDSGDLVEFNRSKTDRRKQKKIQLNFMSYLDSTLKKLSILSGNKCAFPTCPLPLIDENGTLTGEICHIKARNSGGKRYDSTQTNKERDAYENLVLMCALHHTVIDSSEEIFTVESLQKIKKDHESQNTESNAQGKLEILIEKLHSIVEKDNVSSDSTKLLKEKNSALMKAQKLAAENTHNERRQRWLYSNDGLRDALNSIREIYSLIEQQISSDIETFAALGIALNKEDKFKRAIYNKEFGCQLELEGFDENSYENTPANIRLKIWLFSKKPTYQQGFYTEAIKRFHFKPDLLPDGQVTWNEIDRTSLKLPAEGICEKMFDLLITEIGKKKPQRSSWKEDYIRDNQEF
jgi:hypothetical protein